MENLELVPKTRIFDFELYEKLNPAQHKGDMSNFKKNWDLRDKLRKDFGVWNYPIKQVIDSLKTVIGNHKCLEIGAGSGVWNMMLKNAGVDIVATDSCCEFPPTTPIFSDMYKMTADDAVEHFRDATVLISVWSMGFLHSALSKFKGDYVVFVGELDDGCTAFINTFKPDCQFKELTTIEGYIPFFGIRDAVVVYQRK